MNSEPTDEESSGKKKQLDLNDNEAVRIPMGCEESTEGEDDNDDDVDEDTNDDDEDDSDSESAQNGPSLPCSVNDNENLLMCMSPPKYDRMSKRSKKQTRSDKQRSGKGGAAKATNRSRSKGKGAKRPALVNSAENIDKAELAKNTFLSEKLNELQEQRKVNESGSVSAPATASIKTSPSSNNATNHFAALHLAPSDSDLNPLDRRDRKDKTQKLLELALKSNNQTNNSQTLYKQQKQSFFSVATATAFAVAAQVSAHLDENHKKHLNNNIWKELYDFFDHNNDRAKNLNEIELRLRAERAKIAPKIDNIKQTSFGFIKKVMNKEIANIKTPIGYSSLYENKNYIDQLCYLYYLVEDLINEIGAIENLYPSIEALRKDQPSYADKNFEATIKTLILWYKLIINLMNKSDILGKILGFRKNAEYADYWTWFDKRLNYSKNEFQYVQKWLCDNVETTLPQISSESTITSLVDMANVTCMTSTQTTPTNQHPIYSPSISVTRPSNQNLVEIATHQYQRLQQQPQTRIDRQISFTIKSNNSNTNLLYNNFGASEIGSNQDISSNATYGHNDLEDNMSHLSLMSNLSTSSINNSNNTNYNSNSLSLDTQQSLLNPEQLASQLLKCSNEQNEHLKSAKLYHLSSFIASRSSSYKSTGSQSPLSPTVYKSLIDLQNEHDTNTVNQSTDDEDARVIFTISGDIASATVESCTAGDPTTAEYLMNAASGESTKNTELNKKRETILSEFLRKRLRKCGLTKTFNDLRDVLLDTLFDTLQALQIDRCERYTLTGCDDHFYYHLMPLHHKCKEFISKYTLDDETMAYGVKCDTYKRLDLPSFRPLYLYLCSVLIELMHLCIRMQIENKKDIKVSKDYKFSLLSTEVLTNECRECIEQSILIRQLYYHMIFSVFDRTELDVQSALEADLVKFDEDLKEIINIYLNFITNWVQDLVSNSDLSKALWVLNDEWKFCKNNLYFVTASEDIYAKRFCTMTCFINGRLQHNLNDIDSKFKQPIMEYISNMKMKEDMGNYDMENSLVHSSGDALEAELNKNLTDSQQLNDSQHEYNDHEYELAGSDVDGNGELDDTLSQNEGENINLKCNEFKDEINQMRKYAMKALGFCGKLINDLELAARYEVRSGIQELLDELKTSNHVLIIFTNPELNSSYSTTPESSASSFDHLINNSPQSFMIFVPQEFSKEKLQIIRLLFIISEKDEFGLDSSNSNYKNSPSLDLFSSSSSSSLPTNRPVGLDSTEKNLFNDTVFKKNPKQKPAEPTVKTVPFRRLSSSNSVIEMTGCLNKLSKLANIDCQEDQPASTNTTSGAGATTSTSSQDPVSAFIISPNTNTKKDGYLLFLQLTKTPKPNYKWTGPTIQLYASTPVRNSLYKHKSILNSQPTPKLILVTPKQSVLNEKRTELKQKLRGTISLIKEKTSFHPNIEYAIDELKDSILNLRKESVECIKSIEKDLSLHYEAETKCIGNSIIDQRYLSELWRVSYNFGIELQNECIKFMTQDRAETFSLDLAEFAILWCEYIVNKTDRGKGRTVRPWAANKGIQLLQEAVAHSDNLNDLTFSRLIQSVQKCILHVIGDRNTGRLSAGSETASLHHNNNLMRPSHSMIDSRQLESSRETSTHIVSATIADHPNMSVPHFGIDNNGSLMHEQPTHATVTRSSSVASKKYMRESPKNRFNKECNDLDKQRQEKLVKKRFIGRIHEMRRPDYILNTTEVSFRWQLGLLIGEGQFGKVYSCVNLDTGEPMALKKIQFKANDTKQVQSIADEINNVQGIEHENLVKFYGAELHRKEILIFMEFCGDQSTLNRIARDASGLPEKIVRDYTKSLLKAVECLHENNIMHRDIKGANIFLKTIDPYHPERTVLKLGDFGCSIKFKDPIDPSNKERATGFMGTFAFMAPEVMACGGSLDVKYDVPADIWSLGCVVIEMFTGKHPWHPLSDEKILYMVHIEAKMLKPPYPSDISDEASNFLDSCLEYKPNQRLTADKLLDHSFVKVPVHEDRYSSI